MITEDACDGERKAITVTGEYANRADIIATVMLAMDFPHPLELVDDIKDATIEGLAKPIRESTDDDDNNSH